jgi:hypothetical protein
VGEKRTKGNTDSDGKIRLTVGGSSSSVAKTKAKQKADLVKANALALKNREEEIKNVILIFGDEDIPRNNILARFRRRGYIDVVRLCISWI